mmetsp:Transcript_28862/g.85256  ORF Transcript_28862/g.85256 Transcript_28862/m.85256 type:complete len:236 (+) Transcript_28862:495-1202(+)
MTSTPWYSSSSFVASSPSSPKGVPSNPASSLILCTSPSIFPTASASLRFPVINSSHLRPSRPRDSPAPSVCILCREAFTLSTAFLLSSAASASLRTGPDSTDARASRHSPASNSDWSSRLVRRDLCASRWTLASRTDASHASGSSDEAPAGPGGGAAAAQEEGTNASDSGRGAPPRASSASYSPLVNRFFPFSPPLPPNRGPPRTRSSCPRYFSASGSGSVFRISSSINDSAYAS